MSKCECSECGKENSKKRAQFEEFRSSKDNTTITGVILFLVILSTLAVFAVIKLRNRTMLKILGKLTDMLKESRNISQVHRFLMKKFRIMSEIEMDSYDVRNDVRTDPKSGTAYIVNESGILNYAFLERIKTPLDKVLNNGSTTVRSYKWNTQHNGNEYINCYFAKDKLVGLGYTFYPLESAGNELKAAITSSYNMVSDLLKKSSANPERIQRNLSIRLFLWTMIFFRAHFSRFMAPLFSCLKKTF